MDINRIFSILLWVIMLGIVLTMGLIYTSDFFSDPQSPEAQARAEMQQTEWQIECANKGAEIVEYYFSWCEGDVKDLLSNWNDSSEPHKYYDIMMPCFCGNTTEIRYRVVRAESRLEVAVLSSKAARNHLENVEWRTSKSVGAVCLPSRYSNMLAGMNLSIDAIEHTNDMLDMIDSGNASYDDVHAEAKVAADLHYQAAHRYSDASCGYSPDWWRESLRMVMHSYEQGDRLYNLMVEMREHDENVSMVIDTNRTAWGFCDGD